MSGNMPLIRVKSGFCKAFSDEPEMFSHGISPLKDMLVNLNMINVMIWPRSVVLRKLDT